MRRVSPIERATAIAAEATSLFDEAAAKLDVSSGILINEIDTFRQAIAAAKAEIETAEAQVAANERLAEKLREFTL